MNRKLIASLVSVIALAASNASAGLTPENLCTRALARADQKFADCMLGVVGKSWDGGTYRDHYARCINKLAAAWAALASLTGTECAGARWEDNLDGTVTDHLTGLIWEIKGNGDGVENLSDVHDADNRYQHSDDSDSDLTDDDGSAYTDFLATLNSGAGFAGSRGWRLPSSVELATIVTPVPAGTSWGASADPIFGAQPNTLGRFYLTTSGFPGVSTIAVVVQFDPDNIGTANGDRTILSHARAVRGGR